MQFRFREYDEENQDYKLITYCNIEDYDIMFKTLTYMKEHNCIYPIEINTESIVETLGNNYKVIDVALCLSEETGKKALRPHFVVDVEEY